MDSFFFWGILKNTHLNFYSREDTLENAGLKYDGSEMRILCLTSILTREKLPLSPRLALA